MMSRIPQDSFPVKKVWLQVAPMREDNFWTLAAAAVGIMTVIGVVVAWLY